LERLLWKLLRKRNLKINSILQNVEYARSLLTQLERSLPQLKPLDRKHEAQAEIARDRQLLKRIQTILDEEEAKAEANQDDDEDNEDGDDEWKELFSKPVSQEKATSPASQPKYQQTTTQVSESQVEMKGTSNPQSATNTNVPYATTTTHPEPTPNPQTSTPAPPTLRSRHTTNPITSTNKATASGNNAKLHDTETELSTHRMEQEDLTSSLLTLAAQLKTSSKSFQSTLEGEKSALDRAVSGIDRTSTTMEAAGKRMGMLRKMTEGKGLWGRMMLYAWIFGLWVIAILIVYVGPKLRF
jgi:chemotaxis protein histidine kinase CheA